MNSVFLEKVRNFFFLVSAYGADTNSLFGRKRATIVLLYFTSCFEFS
jgi:hypothetical protein